MKKKVFAGVIKLRTFDKEIILKKEVILDYLGESQIPS